jgi:hypothetical protein
VSYSGWASASSSRQAPVVRYGSASAPPASTPAPVLCSLRASVADMFAQAGIVVTHDIDMMVNTIASRLTANTWRTYSSAFRQFVRFCDDASLPYLPASQEVGLLWAVHLAKRGTVQADSAGGYFSGVNTVHELLGHPKPCTGMLFDSFKRGWVKSQVVLVELEDSARVLACPAKIAWAWYEALGGISDDSPWLAPLLYCCLSFRLFVRPATMLSITDAEVFKLGDTWKLRYKPECYKTRSTTVGRLPVMDLDLTAYPLLLNALQLYMGVITGSRLWGPELTTTAQAAAVFTAVLAEFTPEAMGQLTLYSCRRGGASAARAVGVSTEAIELMGGWARGSVAMRRSYLDMSVPADAAAYGWFGCLLPGRATAPLFGAPYYHG